MSSDRISFYSHLPAPCIVDFGTVVNKQDMRRLLCDLGPVRYRYTQDDHCISEGEGYVVGVFADPNEATLVTNYSLYLNICSFDYLELSQIPALDDGSQSSTQDPTPSLPLPQSNSSQCLQDQSFEKPSAQKPAPQKPAPQKSADQKQADQKQAHQQTDSLASSKEQQSDPSPQDSSPKKDACFKLVQENTVLQLIPLSNPLKSRHHGPNTVALDAVVADMLSTNLEMNDDDDCFPF